jgi:hypothetical protein
MRLPQHAEHGVVGPTDTDRSGPRGPLRRRRHAVMTGALVALLAGGLGSLPQPSGTEALFVSRAHAQINVIDGGIWVPDPPAACGAVEDYVAVVYGTQGDDVLYGGNHPQIIMGLAGNDTIYGGNSGDCLVGGPGNDHLIGGNSKDILLGGPGNDYLDGGNAKDYLDGEDDADDCDGGNGQDDVVNCDGGALVAPLSLTQQPAPDDAVQADAETPGADTTAQPVPEQPGPDNSLESSVGQDPAPENSPDPSPGLETPEATP